jgi:hypothetical protein
MDANTKKYAISDSPSSWIVTAHHRRKTTLIWLGFFEGATPLIELVPGLRPIAALTTPTLAPQLQALQDAAHTRNVELSILRIVSSEEVAAAVDEAEAAGGEAMNVLASPVLWATVQTIMERVAALRLPTIYAYPKGGGLEVLSPTAASRPSFSRPR